MALIHYEEERMFLLDCCRPRDGLTTEQMLEQGIELLRQERAERSREIRALRDRGLTVRIDLSNYLDLLAGFVTEDDLMGEAVGWLNDQFGAEGWAVSSDNVHLYLQGDANTRFLVKMRWA